MGQPKVLVYSMFYFPEIIATGKYSSEMCSWLAHNDMNIRVITALPFYPQWKVFDKYSKWKYRSERFEGVKVIKCPLYVPRRPTGVKRIIHLLSFAITSFPVFLWQVKWKPEVIIVVAPTIFCAPTALLLAKITKCKTFLHIQDFELNAMAGLNMFPKAQYLYNCFEKIENKILRSFGIVSTISKSMRQKLIAKGVGKANALVIPNWSQFGDEISQADSNYYRKKWNIGQHKKIVLYAGNLGFKQGFEMLIEAAKRCSQYEDVIFLIVGEGAYKQQLIRMASDQNLDNIRFYDLQPPENLVHLLTMADVHLVLQKQGVADYVFPSKLANILAVGGVAIVTANEDTDLGRLITQNPGVANLSAPENIEEFMRVLMKVVNGINTEQREINAIAKQFSDRHLNKDKILSDYKNILLESMSCR